MVSIFPTAFNLRFNGVSNSSWLSSIPAMLPTSVFIPVAITTPVPRPYITMEDEAEEIVPMEYGSLQIFKIVDGEGGSTTKKFGFILSIMNKDNTPFTGKLPYTMASGDKGVLQFDKNGRAGFELSHGQYIFFD